MENKTKFNYTEAAQLTGLTRQTIAKKVEQGELSAEKDARDKKVIDLSELHRYFGGKITSVALKPNGKLPRQETSELTSILRSEIERLVREVNVMREERDAERRAREREQEEARAEREKFLAIISTQTHMLAAPKEPERKPEPKKSWWRWTIL